jgi:LmbE family N-acetylglucosaminyl deacetylase
MVIGAHPDDEALVAPLLGKACVDDGARCSFLVATRGEAGDCALPQGCGADLGQLRSEEMRAAAVIFRASLTQWTLVDTMTGGPEGVRAAWAAQSGGDEALVSRIRAAIDQVSPTVIITFDPHHGSSCHPAHRALGGLVLDATAVSTARPLILLVETVDRYDATTSTFSFASAVTPATPIAIFDGNSFLPSVNDSAWRYLVLELGAHSSQFSAAQRETLAAQPADQRRIFLMPASQTFVEYTTTCL